LASDLESMVTLLYLLKIKLVVDEHDWNVKTFKMCIHKIRGVGLVYNDAIYTPLIKLQYCFLSLFGQT
jgi:hypothetical protein